MSTIVENINSISVEIEPKHSVLTQTGAIVEIIEPDYIVHAQRKEYKVVGDNIYIPKLYDDAPQWMKDIIGTVVDVKTAVATGNLNDALEALRTLATELEVAKNTYTMSIVSSNDIDQRINTAIETLNSSLSNADATILNIAQTAVTPEEASAIAVNTLSASLSASGAIGSFIANMNAAFADLDSATTESINYMESAIEAEFSANATAVQTIRTYVGIDEAGASTGTGLSAYLEGSDGTIGGADSQLVNNIRVTAERVETKLAYNSTVNINGVYKKSGFGLTTNYTSGAGTQANPYVSEFWIDASILKFTNSAQTGRTAPFTIDATGATPKITFNGKVSFTNVTGYTPPDVSGDINANNNAFAIAQGFASYVDMSSKYSALGKTIINGGYINTGLVRANSIVANSVSADRLMAGTNGSTVWNGGGLVSSNFNGNVYGNIGSPSQGFRLSSNAVGTSSDPNIYGAYIKGATLEGTSLNVNDIKVKAVGYDNNFGPLSLSSKYINSSSSSTTYAISDVFYGRGYSSGYLQTRMCTSTLTFKLVVTGNTWVNTSGDIGTNYAYIQANINGTGWVTIYTTPGLRMSLGGSYSYSVNTLDNVQFRAYINNDYISTKLTVVELDIQATNYGV